ncbi:hypothetical protein RCIX1601 [Methanocella arvoryzae MRE50]|uniref:Uncharacterized protein n=2 Tax=Methanocella TaxID=570266 RepID=Q0W448_METAR|nr:hypothetical protein RCIX1601 [Methanocella arvoryzae MRE50]
MLLEKTARASLCQTAPAFLRSSASQHFYSPVTDYHVKDGGVEMEQASLTRKALIALILVSMLVVPALATSTEAQLYQSQFSQFGSGIYGQQQYPYTQQPGLLPQSSCPPGYYYDSYSRQCVPAQQPYPPGGPCPSGYFYDRFRQQCVPYMTAQGYGY